MTLPLFLVLLNSASVSQTFSLLLTVKERETLETELVVHNHLHKLFTKSKNKTIKYSIAGYKSLSSDFDVFHHFVLLYDKKCPIYKGFFDFTPKRGVFEQKQIKITIKSRHFLSKYMILCLYSLTLYILFYLYL